jgi:cytoskeletal protein CcmA (bactofilin family)
VAEAIRRDLKVIGETTSAGGQFHHIKVTGECEFKGDVDCIKLSSTGEIVVNGDLRTDELKLTGHCEIKGGLNALRVRGRGELKVFSGMRGENMMFTGNIDAEGDCEAGVFEVSGGFNVRGLLSADSLEVKMFGPCLARELGGGKLRIKRSRASALVSLIKLKNMNSATLNAELIEGDDIELEYTAAAIVRGKSVSIGSGCQIYRVEYRDSLHVHKSAIVKEKVQLLM